MGWYETCEICGNESKYTLTCDCNEKEDLKVIAKMEHCYINKIFFVKTFGDCFGEDYEVKSLLRLDESLFYVSIHRGSGEYLPHRKYKEISKEEYNEFLKEYEGRNEVEEVKEVEE